MLASNGQGPHQMYGSVSVNSEGTRSPSDPLDNVYVLSKWRWGIILIYCMMNFTSNVNWLTYSTISQSTQEFYHISEFSVNFLSTEYLLASIAGYVFFSWVVKRRGLRFVVVFSAVVNLIGAWIRCLAPVVLEKTKDVSWTYFVLAVGQGICAISQPCIVVVPNQVAATWMSVKERTVAVSLSTLSMMLGMMGIDGLSPAVVKVPSDIPKLQMILAYISTAVGLLIIFFFKEAPPTPPCPTGKSSHLSFKEGFFRAIKNRNFLVLTTSYAFALGCFQVLMIKVDELVSPSGYTESEAGDFAMVLLGLGIVSGTIAGFLIDRWRKYKTGLIISGTLASLSLGFIGLATRPNNFGLLFTAFALTGIFALPVMPLALEVVATLIVVVLSFVPPIAELWIIAGTCFSCVCLIMFFKPEYKRFEAETLEEAQPINVAAHVE